MLIPNAVSTEVEMDIVVSIIFRSGWEVVCRCVVWLALYKADHTADMTQVQNATRKRKEILMGVVE